MQTCPSLISHRVHPAHVVYDHILVSDTFATSADSCKKKEKTMERLLSLCMVNTVIELYTYQLFPFLFPLRFGDRLWFDGN